MMFRMSTITGICRKRKKRTEHSGTTVAIKAVIYLLVKNKANQQKSPVINRGFLLLDTE